MSFESEAERMQHPQAKLIPPALWNHPHLFDKRIHESSLALMAVKDKDIIPAIEKVRSEWWFSLEKRRDWLAIALSHPHLSDESLHHIANKIGMSNSEIFEVSLALGKLSFIEKALIPYSNSHANYVEILVQSCKSGLFTLVLSPEHQDIFNYLMTFLKRALNKALRSNNNIYSHSNFYDLLDFASEQGHLTMFNRLVDFVEAPGSGVKVRSLLKFYDYALFRKALKTGCLATIKRCVELAKDHKITLKKMLEASGNELLRGCRIDNPLDILNYFLTLAKAQKVNLKELLESTSNGVTYRVFVNAVQSENHEAINVLINLAKDQKVNLQAMLKDGVGGIFFPFLSLDILSHLLKLANSHQLKTKPMSLLQNCKYFDRLSA